MILGSNCKSDKEDCNRAEETAKGCNVQNDSDRLGHETSEQSFKEWANYWETVRLNKIAGILNIAHGMNIFLFYWAILKI